MSAWRIVKAKYAATAFDGEGAKRSGGRWNSPGMSVIYTAGTQSLAVLEMLAHLGTTAVLAAFVLIECRFNAGLVIPLQRAILPKHWRAHPPPPELKVLGDKWVKLGDSAILEVPSALVPAESLFLLNPAHRDFKHIEVLDPGPFELDMRLVKSTT